MEQDLALAGANVMTFDLTNFQEDSGHFRTNRLSN